MRFVIGVYFVNISPVFPFWLQKTKRMKIVTTNDVKTMFRRLTNYSVPKSYNDSLLFSFISPVGYVKYMLIPDITLFPSKQ
ncbi:hypothetical protein HR10_04570 [Porphyromonas gulae]|uniref:Uncharacterized protein n=1 Tax=Porphyromonas gulae TaxID=111105 RepID=A0A0A2FGT3_9PORP|nr:hypothetical protein HR15_05970 [Porphyromonas gulae]KKC51281.1 hypothetical protein HR10_04570 [Porphyromonas gulae]